MDQNVGKILRCVADVSFVVVFFGDESVSLTSDCCDVGVDGCCCLSCWCSVRRRVVLVEQALR